MDSFAEFERRVALLTDLGVIEDASKIWWDLRPSSKFPTIESRICDVSPRIEDALGLAALTQALCRMLWRLAVKNQRWRLYDQFLVAENRWRAQRYGTSEGLIDFGRREIVPFARLLEELIELTREDAEAFDSIQEIENLRHIVSGGNSAQRQRAVYAEALSIGQNDKEALGAVVRHLMAEFHEGL